MKIWDERNNQFSTDDPFKVHAIFQEDHCEYLLSFGGGRILPKSEHTPLTLERVNFYQNLQLAVQRPFQHPKRQELEKEYFKALEDVKRAYEEDRLGSYELFGDQIPPFGWNGSNDDNIITTTFNNNNDNTPNQNLVEEEYLIPVITSNRETQRSSSSSIGVQDKLLSSLPSLGSPPLLTLSTFPSSSSKIPPPFLPSFEEEEEEERYHAISESDQLNQNFSHVFFNMKKEEEEEKKKHQQQQHEEPEFIFSLSFPPSPVDEDKNNKERGKPIIWGEMDGHFVNDLEMG